MKVTIMRLSPDVLAKLATPIKRPAYDRNRVTTGIVHLGIGAFHRAHQAAYTEKVLASGDLRWGIVGASLRSPDTLDALNPQRGLYTLNVRSGAGDDLAVIGAIKDVLVAPESPAALIEAMARADVKIVTLTVTEKGYCHDPATGQLNESHPDIVHDLANPTAPRSAIGFLVEALARRRAHGVKPFTVLCCDNLPSNGKTVRRVVTRFAQLRDKALGDFVAAEVKFPSTMVDRIVPATTDEDRDLIAQSLGVTDAWPVMTEPFTQWVIEDDFGDVRPAWDRFGAEFVKDVEPYEHMKLRLLNGSHSTLAYLGYLAGYQTVADAMSDKALAQLIADLMEFESAPTLHMPPGADVAAYRASLLQRFRNPALKHRTWQIAMDGSQKLPQRLLGTARDRIAQGLPIERIALGVAAWMRYVTGVDEQGAPIDVRDPLAAQFKTIAAQAKGDPTVLAEGLFGIEAIFGKDLPLNPAFTGPVKAALANLYAKGAKATVAAMPKA
jgi:fructuronate reductase